MSEEIIIVPNSESILTVFGACDRHLRRVADALNVRIWCCRREIHIVGAQEQVQKAQQIIRQALNRPFVSDDDVSCLLNEAQYSDFAPTNYPPPRFSLPDSPFPDSFQENESVPTAFDFSPNALPKTDKFNYSFMEKDSESSFAGQVENVAEGADADCQPFGDSNTSNIYKEASQKGRNLDGDNDGNPDAQLDANPDSPIEVRPLEVFTGRKIRPRTPGTAEF